jgi:integrase/recombinase XerD
MAYQYRREPLTQHEATNLANACTTGAERLVVWTLLDTGLRVSELTSLTRRHIDWQQHRLIIYGKGGQSGLRSKRRVVPLSPRVQSLLEPYQPAIAAAPARSRVPRYDADLPQPVARGRNR